MALPWNNKTLSAEPVELFECSEPIAIVELKFGSGIISYVMISAGVDFFLLLNIRLTWDRVIAEASDNSSQINDIIVSN